MDRKTYMREVYSRYWIDAREKIYGFLEYDKHLCARINAEVALPASIIEVAIGTGYPFSDHFDKAGYAVHGVDISPDLIEKCRQLHPRVKSEVGDAEHLSYSDGSFDCAFCFHSTWYFPDLNRAIGEMIRVVKPGGHVYFDIQNMDNPLIAANFKRREFFNSGIGVPLKYLKNIVKMILRRRDIDWTTVTHEVPTVPSTVHEYLGRAPIKGYSVLGRQEDESLTGIDGSKEEANFARLVFCVVK